MIMLTGSVGQNGMNRRDDTKIVQLLLNDYLGRVGLTLLKIDGIAGPLTIEAITKFQSWSNSPRDGRVDPHGPTIRRLVGSHFDSVNSAMNNTYYGKKLMRYAKQDVYTTNNEYPDDCVSWYLQILKTNLK
jgi:peptidoglycan hydrolase-like protein with peptidoglycan-binding domain